MTRQNSTRLVVPKVVSHAHPDRPQKDVEFQRRFDTRVREQSERTYHLLRLRGLDHLIITEPGLGYGLPVLPNPARRGDGYIAWTVR
jgi:hypothetical protein